MDAPPGPDAGYHPPGPSSTGGTIIVADPGPDVTDCPSRSPESAPGPGRSAQRMAEMGPLVSTALRASITSSMIPYSLASAAVIT